MSYVYTEVTVPDSVDRIYVNSDSVRVEEVIGATGGVLAPTAHTAMQKNEAYVFRKMPEPEFHATLRNKKLIPPKVKKSQAGEKWFTEHLDHSRTYQNAERVDQVQRVAEIAVNKDAYAKIRSNAIPQKGSKIKQPPTGTKYNITNTEKLGHRPDKLNMGLKGEANVEGFNKHIISIKEVNPDSFVNKSEALMWIRRNKFKTAAVAVGIAIDVGYITISVIDDGGEFGANTQIAVGEIAGGLAFAEAATAIGTAIGAYLGTVVPGIGTVIIGFIGGLIGSIVGGGLVRLMRLWFSGGPIAPGPGAPLLDTDPYPTARGIPSTGIDTQASGVPSLQTETHAKGVLSTGLHTGARGMPKSDFKTRGQKH